ncbi:hypothetical protein F4804DRAFT_335123 [Jackrogersella minutella]|nr:hypothetical protein F4804DRAFT_335123 [Jackrogersella minutella]
MNPQHTAESAPDTPSIANLHQRKRELAAPDTESWLQDLINKQYAKVEREARIQKEVITKLAATLDEFSQGSRQREDLRFLVRVSEDHMEWAKKHTRISVRLPREQLDARPPPYAARIALTKALELPTASIRDAEGPKHQSHFRLRSWLCRLILSLKAQILLRGNPALQRIIDNGTPTRVEPFTPTQPTKRKRTAQVPTSKTVTMNTGKVPAAPARHSGLQASAHNQPDDSTATGAFMSAMAEFHRKQDARQEVLGLVARSLDNVVSTCNDTDKKARPRPSLVCRCRI